LEEADRLHDANKETLVCPQCSNSGSINKDSAGSGAVKRRRYKCRICSATCSVANFLAVNSGQAPVARQRAPDAARQTDNPGASSVSSETRSPDRRAPARPAARPTSAAQEQQVAASSEQAGTSQQADTSQQAGTSQQGTAAQGYNVSAEERKRYIEATLDRLGLSGPGRKRRRQALEVLLPMGAPCKDKLTRIAIPCGNVNAAAAREAIRALKVDPRLIHHVLKTPTGIELVVMEGDAMAIKAKASQQGLIVADAMPERPTTRKECDALLKALKPASHTAQHGATRQYFLEWIAGFKDNMPEHVRAQRPDEAAPYYHTCVLPDGTEDRPSAGAHSLVAHSTVAYSAVEHTSDPLDAVYLGDYQEEYPRIGDIDFVPEHEEPLHVDSLSQDSANGSINITSAYMASWLPTASDVQSTSIQGTPASVQHWIGIEYVNAYGLNSTKLATALGHLKPNTLLFIAETWHIHDAKMRTATGVVAISPELLRNPQSRGKGGLALLAHESVASRLRIVSIEEFHISVTINDLSISGIYLPPSMSNAAVKAVLDALPKSTDMVLGDLNARLGKDTRTAERDRCNVISTWCTRNGLGLKTPDTEIFTSKIDHILARPTVHCKEYHVATAPFRTDHPLLTMQVLTNGPSTGKQTVRFNIHRLKSPETATKLCNAVEVMAIRVLDALVYASRSQEALDAKMTIESLDDNLTCLVQKSLRDTVGTRRPSGLYTRGGSAKATSTDMVTAIQAIRAAQRECKSKCELISLDETLSPMEEAVKHYTAIYRRVADRPQERWNSTNNTSPGLLTAKDLADAIKAYPSGKSPGVDGIDRRVMWLLTRAPVFMRLLKSLYNMCLRTGITPRRWNQSVISPIPKAGKDPKYISNRRPVALTVLYRRIFEKLILHTIVHTIKLNRGQAGFRNGFSCTTQIMLAEQARHNGQNIRVFLDLKCAYDSVPTDKMLVKLANKGTPKYLVKLVESMFTGCSTVIAVNGTLTQPVKLQKGLFQGSLMSPILFDVFIDDMADAINNNLREEIPECLLFADDILLACRDVKTSQDRLDMVAAWCTCNEMQINILKSGTTHTGTPLLVSGLALPVVETYRYLGVPLGRTGIEPKGLIEENIRRATGALALVKSTLASRSWPQATKVNVYKTFIRSVFEHGAPTLVLLHSLDLHKRQIKNGIKKMQELQDDAVRWIFHKRRPQSTLESLAGLNSVRLRFHELTAHLRLHLMRLSEDNPIRYWTDNNIGSGITFAARNYLLPAEKTAKSITAQYRAWSADEASRDNRMAGYIDPACRLANGMDACLTIQNPRLRCLAINWRCNTFGMYQKCKTCNQPFNRRHAQCVQLPMRTALRAVYADATVTGEAAANLLPLDLLLNKREYSTFQRCIKTVQNNLEKALRPALAPSAPST
jgi:hypothetical protein